MISFHHRAPGLCLLGFLWLALAAGFARPLAAEESDEIAAAIYELPPVRVEGDRIDQQLEGELRSLTRTLILPDEHPRRQATPVDLLREVAGLELRRYGGLGSFSTASLRGSGGQEVAVFLDGVDLRHPFTGLALLDELPLAGVGRVEVYRGGVPTELGGGATAGAIHLVSSDSGKQHLSLGMGSYATRRAAFHWSAPGPWGLRAVLSGGHLASSGAYEYLDRSGTTQANAADDTLRLRRNADSSGQDLLLRLAWEPRAGGQPGGLELFYRYLRRENGIPGSETLPTFHTRSLRNSQDLRLSGRTPLLARRLRLRATGYARDGWSRFLNPQQETGPFLVADESKDHLLTLGAQLHADLYLLPFHLLLRGERRMDRYLPENLNPRKGQSYERKRRGERLEAEARLLVLDQRLLLVAAYGEEWLEDNYYGEPSLPWLAAPQPRHLTHAPFKRAGIQLRALDRGGARGRIALEFSLNAGDGYRPPNLLELFGQDVSVLGNADLRPERGWQGDAGFQLQWRLADWSGEFGLSAFRRDIRDQILFLRNSQYSTRAQNIAASRIGGWELEGRLHYRALWSSAAFTEQRATDRSGLPEYDGKALPYRSPRRLFLRLGVDAGLASVFVEMDQRAAVHPDRYNDPDRLLPAARLWGAGLRLRLGAGLSLSAEAMNLGDLHFEDILGYPLPGRSWLMGVEWSSRLGAEKEKP